MSQLWSVPLDQVGLLETGIPVQITVRMTPGETMVALPATSVVAYDRKSNVSVVTRAVTAEGGFVMTCGEEYTFVPVQGVFGVELILPRVGEL